MRAALALLLGLGACCSAEDTFLRTTAIGNAGDVESVYGILERILPGERANFQFALAADDDTATTVPDVRLVGSGAAGFELEAKSGKVKITASGTSELAAGLGFYLREHCNNVIGWPRGGGSKLFKPKGGWPDASFKKSRIVPWSYAMNVCVSTPPVRIIVFLSIVLMMSKETSDSPPPPPFVVSREILFEIGCVSLDTLLLPGLVRLGGLGSLHRLVRKNDEFSI